MLPSIERKPGLCFFGRNIRCRVIPDAGIIHNWYLFGKFTKDAHERTKIIGDDGFQNYLQ